MPAVLLLVAMALAACGDSDGDQTTDAALPAESSAAGSDGQATGDGSGGDGGGAGSGPSDEQQISAAIEGLVVDPDSGYVCAEVISPSLLKAAYGDLQGCLKGRRAATLAESVKISGPTVDGDSATAEAVPKGGLYDGATLEIEAVRTGEGWRIDQFLADIPVGP
jgi:hypothetical protein